jgi:hypothetical protein
MKWLAFLKKEAKSKAREEVMKVDKAVSWEREKLAGEKVLKS